MFHIWHWEGSGWLAIIGFGLVMATEGVLRVVAHDPSITAPRSWWLISGYVVAAAYCLFFDFILRFLDAKHRSDPSMRRHSLMSIPVRYWSFFYLLIGILRVYSPK